jgi:hypothetical protein
LLLYVKYFVTQRLQKAENDDPIRLQQALRVYAEKNPPSGSVLKAVVDLLRGAIASDGVAEASKSIMKVLGKNEAVVAPVGRREPAAGEVRAGPFASFSLGKKGE